MGSVVNLMIHVCECNVYVHRYVCLKLGMNEKPAVEARRRRSYFCLDKSGKATLRKLTTELALGE